MRLRCVAAAAAALCITGADLQAQKQIRLLATVSNPSGEPVTTIEPKDIGVIENGTPATVVKVEGFSRVSKVQILIDNGLGIPKQSIADLRTGLTGLLEALPANIETTVVTTAPQPRFIERGTADKAKLMKAVQFIAPASGAGRFVESLDEATQRVEKEPNSFHTIVSVGTTAGDLNVRDADIERIVKRTNGGRFRLFAVLVSVGVGTTLSSGETQESVGEAVAKNTGGRFEKINAPSRLVTLLPEIGTEVAKTVGPSTRQFRITVDRPPGMTGALGRMSMAVAGLLVSDVLVEGP